MVTAPTGANSGRMKKYTSIVTLMLFVTQVNAANITATLDRNVVGINESFQLRLEADGNTGEPDFSPLQKDFDILDQAHSKNLSVINGVTSRQLVWNLVLMAKKVGELQIPAISFGNDKSQAINIVAKQQADKSSVRDGMYLDLEADINQPFVQQQVVLTVRLFLRQGEVSSATLSELEVEGVDTIIERLGEDKDYQEIRDGLRWRIVERKYVVFPQQTGHMTVKPLTFSGHIRNRSNIQGFDIFNQAPTKRFVIRSESITLPVREPPASFGPGWLPAKTLTMEESWPERLEAKVGDPITRQITIKAEGLTAAQLPELPIALPDGLRVYPEQAKLSNSGNRRGVVGTRIETIAIIPTEPGPIVLPEIRMAWWNVDKQQPELATIPSRTLEVASSVADSMQQTPTTSAGVSEEELAQTESDNALGMESVQFESGPWWPWVSLGFALMWLITIAVWVFDRRRNQQVTVDIKNSNPRIDLKRTLTNLKQACESEDAAVTRDALLLWGAALWPDTPPRNLGQMASRCGEPLSHSIRSLEQVLYGAGKDWSSALLAEQASTFKVKEDADRSEQGITLEPMYR